MATKYRAQILLEPDQQRTLARLAEEQGRSVSDLVRQAVQQYLDAGTQVAHKERQLEALRRLRRLREQIRERHGVLDVDLIREAREEREADLERVWKGAE